VNTLRLAVAQTNPVVGDFASNLETALNLMSEASAKGVDLLVFGELSLTGYPLGDLSYRQDIVAASERSLAELVRRSSESSIGDLTVIVGCVTLAAKESKPSGAQRSAAIAHNSVVAFRGGAELGRYHKRLLPNYDVFDDWRNFVPGENPLAIEIHGKRVAVYICEDIWGVEKPFAQELTDLAPELVVAVNGSPFTLGKELERRDVARSFANGIPILYSNLLGGQDELVFDGDSFLLDAVGTEVFCAETISGVSEATQAPPPLTPVSAAASLEKIWQMLVMGLRDYCLKSGQSRVVLGLSGGIDSAVTATLAVDALGSSSVLGVSLPSRYSSEHSREDAAILAERLGIEFRTIPIEGMHRTVSETIELSGVADENAQARIRALLLMGIANQESRMLLSTGNKSEIAVGYSTIYGDAAGGFAPLKDVYKTLVWRLARWRNETAGVDLIPQSSISKAPSAELRPGQVDQDSLPEYSVLDEILESLIEMNHTVAEVSASGHDRELVARVDGLVRAAEWKRSQGAIGTKITRVAFGSGRRVPIATRFGVL
jgi:NAD+ synthase (glutamine-hydrolysing)